MQKFIEFFELDKDGTWFVILVFVLAIVAMRLLYRFIRYEVKNIRFYHKYGESLSRYCERNYIDDYDYAFFKAKLDKKYEKTLSNIRKNDLIIIDSRISIEQACESMRQLSELINGGF